MADVNKILKWFQNLPIEKVLLHTSGRKNKNRKHRTKYIFEDLTEALRRGSSKLMNLKKLISNRFNLG